MLVKFAVMEAGLLGLAEGKYSSCLINGKAADVAAFEPVYSRQKKGG
jgi:hypothetical protein